MPYLDPLWDTANNRRTAPEYAEGSGKVSKSSEGTHAPGTTERMPRPGEPEPPEDLEQLVQSAYTQGMNYQQQVLQPKWQASYAAFNNQHFRGSKYLSTRYRGRSRLFRPKTRAAVRRKAAEAAAALFQTADVVTVSAGNEADPRQKASAAINKELLNYRLTTAAENSGIPWFLVSMGAHQTAQICAICISKQYWEYKEKVVGYEEVTYGTLGPTGEMQTEVVQEPITRIIRDRPQIILYPPEDVVRDPSANWLNQAQDSSYLILKNSMTLADARTFLKQVDKDGKPMFLPVPEETLLAAANVKSSGTDASEQARRARETSGTDPKHDFSVDKEYQTVWLHENFFRIDGEDWHFWTLGINRIVSDVRPVDKVYPEQGGARPVTIGISSLDAFKADPMSPVEAWAPLQTEINDVVNLRLEVMKQTVAPVTKVRRGRNINLKEVQNRSPDSVIYVDNMDDVDFDRPGAVGQEAFIEMERLNVDFDELAGVFAPGSVQANNQLNKTATGLSLVSGSANSMGEFDLRVWVETWAEDCLRQVMKLEQYWESDERVRAIAGDKAKLREKFGVNQVTDELLTQTVTLRVNIGIGSADPMLKMQKLQTALGAIGSFMPTALQRLRQDSIIDEFFGMGGYKDGSEAFFYPGDDMDPRIQQMGQQLQQAEAMIEDKNADRQNKVQIAQIGAVKDVVKSHLDHRQALEQKRADFVMGETSAMAQHGRDMQSGEAERDFQRQEGDAEHARAVDMKAKDAQMQDYMDTKQGAREQRNMMMKMPPGQNAPAPRTTATGAPGFPDVRELFGMPQEANMQAIADNIMQALGQMMQAQMRNDQRMLQAIAKIAESVGNTASAIEASNRETTVAIGRMGQQLVQVVKNKPKAVFEIERQPNGFMKSVRQVH